MKKPAFAIMALCFVITAAFLLTTCDGGGGGAGGTVWVGIFFNTNADLTVAWAVSGSSISDGEGIDGASDLRIAFTGTQTSNSFSISGTATGSLGNTTFTATGSVDTGSFDSTTASGTYSMTYAGGTYAPQAGEAFSMSKI